MGAEQAEVYLPQVLVVPVVPPLHIGVVFSIGRNRGYIEKQCLFLRLLGNPKLEEGVAPVVGQGGKQLADPLRAKGVAVETTIVQPVLGSAEGLALADAVPCKLKDGIGIVGSEGFLQNRLYADVLDHLVQDEVLSHQRGFRDKRVLGLGGFLPGQVEIVVYLVTIRTESADALSLVLAALLLAVPEGLVLVEVGNTVLLVGDTDDFRRFCIGIYHSYNYTYV